LPKRHLHDTVEFVSSALHNRSWCKSGDTSHSLAATVVTIAGSAGALLAVRVMLSAIPRTLRAAVAVALHRAEGSILAEVLSLHSQLPVKDAKAGDLLRCGWVYVARPRTHLVVNPDGYMSVSSAAALRAFQPSADWLFESAAATYRERHVAVVLSGALWDGAARLSAVKRLGGTVIVQSPDDAARPDMPRAAIATGCVDEIVRTAALADAICRAVDRCDRDGDVSSWERPFAS